MPVCVYSFERSQGSEQVIQNIHELETEQYKRRLHTALKTAKICVFEVDLNRQLYTFFENSEDIFGVPGDKILRDVQPFCNLPPEEYRKAVSDYFSHEDDLDVINKAFQSVFRGQPYSYHARMKAGGSEYIWCKIDVTPIIENSMPVKMIGVIMDISDLKLKTELLEKQVKMDNFTGLYNKTSAEKKIIRSLKENPHQRHALILLDIDRFKALNDTYGHSKGDEALQHITGKLKSCFGKNDVIGRFGGDEFILLIRDIACLDWLKQRLEELVRCDMDGLEITNSIGISLYPDDGLEFRQLFKKADEALYQSKRHRGVFTFFQNAR